MLYSSQIARIARKASIFLIFCVETGKAAYETTSFAGYVQACPNIPRFATNAFGCSGGIAKLKLLQNENQLIL